jgi:hypothetical protein
VVVVYWLVAIEPMEAIAGGCWWRVDYKMKDTVFIGELPVVNNSYFACASLGSTHGSGPRRPHFGCMWQSFRASVGSLDAGRQSPVGNLPRSCRRLASLSVENWLSLHLQGHHVAEMIQKIRQPCRPRAAGFPARIEY